MIYTILVISQRGEIKLERHFGVAYKVRFVPGQDVRTHTPMLQGLSREWFASYCFRAVVERTSKMCNFVENLEFLIADGRACRAIQK